MERPEDKIAEADVCRQIIVLIKSDISKTEERRMKYFIFTIVSTIFVAAFNYQGIAQKSSSVSTDQLPSSEQKISTKNKSDDSKLVEMKKVIFDLLNEERVKIKVAGVEKLKRTDDIDKIAQMQTDDMAINRFFSHKGSDGSMVNDRAAFGGFKKWKTLGENIAFSKNSDDPCKVAVSRWMQSVAHRENLLDARWKLIGIGITQAQDGTFYFDTVFVVPE